MQDIERDKFLTEAMGACWHNVTPYGCTDDFGSTDFVACIHCQEKFDRPQHHNLYFKVPRNDFSTWAGFGKLWEWAQGQEWWGGFRDSESEYGLWTGAVINRLIHPDRFANAIYSFLKVR